MCANKKYYSSKEAFNDDFYRKSETSVEEWQNVHLKTAMRFYMRAFIFLLRCRLLQLPHPVKHICSLLKCTYAHNTLWISFVWDFVCMCTLVCVCLSVCVSFVFLILRLCFNLKIWNLYDIFLNGLSLSFFFIKC